MTPLDPTAQVLQQVLLYLLLPVWLLAGFGDWLCHRLQRIEHSTGLKESLIHVLMLAELGIGIAAVLLLQVDAAVILLLLACCIAHELTTWWDLRYAASKRRIPVAEQWVHSLQLTLPWIALVTLMVIHRDQSLALIGRGAAQADWQWRWKEPPLPAWQLGAVAMAAVVLVAVPFAQEVVRCVRYSREQAQVRCDGPSSVHKTLERRRRQR